MKIKQKPYINPDTCAGCSVCVVNCPLDCLKIEEPKYHGDIHTIAYMASDKCTGCGICAKACPIEAIEMRDVGKAVCSMKTKLSCKSILQRFSVGDESWHVCAAMECTKDIKGTGSSEKTANGH